MKLKRLRIALALLLGFASAGHVQAQFEKTPWPNTQKVPAFSFKDASGREFKPENLRGKKVVLNFWATWCAPCKEELPSLQVFSDLQNPDHIVVLTVNVKEPVSRAQKFMQNNQINLPLISDPQGEWAQKFGVKVYPTTLLLDAKGNIKWRIVGEVDWTSSEPQAWVNALP